MTSTPNLLTFQQFIQNQAAAIQSAATSIINYTTGSVIRALTEAVAYVALYLETQIVQVLALTRFASSQGSNADSWAADFGFTRLPAQAASGLVTFARFTPTAQAIIPVGSLVQTSATPTVQYQLIADPTNTAYNAALNAFIIPAGITSISATVVATTTGSGTNAIAGAISQLGQAISGVDTVTNAAPFTNGLAAETDAAFKLRFVAYINSLAQGTRTAIGAAISAIQQGLTYSITEDVNYAGAATPASFYVVVDDGSGAPPSSLLTLVYNAVNAVRAAGITFAVFAPTVLTATVTLTITVAAGYTKATYQPIVQNAILAYINALAVGASLPYTKLAEIAYDAAPGVITNVTALLLDSGTADITATTQQVIKATSGGVTVS